MTHNLGDEPAASLHVVTSRSTQDQATSIGDPTADTDVEDTTAWPEPEKPDVHGRVGEEFPDLDDDGDTESTSTLSLFESDEGALLFAQRQALVHLIKHPFISAQTHPRDWRTLIGNPRPIRARLNDLFMVLELDTQREVAFTRQATPEGGGRRFPTLFYDQAWTREETIVLLCLRTRSHTEQAAGTGRVFVDRDDIHDYVTRFRPAHATDKVGDRGRVERAIEKVFKTGLLIGRKTGERFEVARAIDTLMPLSRLTELLAWLRQQNTDGAGDPTTPADRSPAASVTATAPDHAADSGE
ncbi:DUF4194 domain-containing protein [Saccharothrix luteola]|uniref:DUF4194 domain-containing protein n=1 Tax=Saccharothrix luteola TaxID=2893018 RepID=UPI001E52D237|nr:DUF4194 domain-containing protein [Saccharothrix luteola]MCC8251193.1 DUF4194 domain-containing protein [Saccharothrix luteola]